MNDWEQHFREKSRRRAQKKRGELIMKAAVLALVIGSLGTAIYMLVEGVPR